MSPVESSGHHAGRAALVALVGVVVLFGTLGLITLTLKDRNSPDLQLGDQTFKAGRAEALAGRIAETGPRLYADVSGRKDRDMILHHIGDDPDSGWYAFLAAPIDKPRDCTWDWQAEDRTFRAKCDRDLIAPADGAGLPQFQVTVVDGQVDVDLNADARKPSGSTTTR
ncbi:MAG: hypothetical protein IPG97_03875 [Microthrixaceae bacterium]|nr:hypothetical protein [Microthrixaceae bacterium]